MKFIIQDPQKDQIFDLFYEDYSFDIEPIYRYGYGGSSIMINDLQLEIDDEGKIMYPWGYCPLIKYEKTKEFPRGYTAHTLVALLDKPPVSGISYRINEDRQWPIYINKRKGWVCLGNPETKDKHLVEFAPNCVAVLEDQEITAVWLKPETLPKLTK